MKHLAVAFKSFVETKQANGDMDEASRKNMASIMKCFVSCAYTTDRKQENLLNRLLQIITINISEKVEQPM